MSDFPIAGWVCLNPKGRHLQVTSGDKPTTCVRPTCGATDFEPVDLAKSTGEDE